ncbi:MAG: phage tail tape measure protein [Nitrospirae bacterium]|nr:phage tail tape measure protein [Nitrospirota bacterium]
MATEIVELILKAKDLASESINRLRGGMEKLQDSAEKIRKTSQEMMDFGTKVGAMGAALTASLAVPVKFAADFERAMSKVHALTGATEEEFKKLSDTAKDLGRTTKFTAEEAAEGMSFLAMAGFKTNEIISAMPSVLQLAAAANLDLGTAADITSNILTGYGMRVEELNRANDVLVKAFTSANTNLVELGQAMKYVGPIAKSAGVEFEETSAAIGMMAMGGIKATMAGTSLRKIITSLIKPVGDGKKKLEEFGITVTDQEGRFVGLSNIIAQFEKAFENVGGEAERTAIIMSIFGDRAGPAMAAMLAEGSGALEEFTQKLKDSQGIAETISERMLKDLWGGVTILKSALSGLLISFGEPFLSALSKAAKSIASVVTKITEFKEALGPAGTVVLGIVGGLGVLLLVVGGLSVALGGLGFVTAAIIKGFAAWSTIIPGLITGIKAVTASVLGLKTSLTASAGASGLLSFALRVGILGAAAVAGVALAGLIYYLIWGRKETEEYKKTLERTAQVQERMAVTAAELEDKYRSLGITQGTLDDKIQEFHRLIKEGVIVWDEQDKAFKRAASSMETLGKTYEDLIATVKFGSEQWMKIMEIEANTLKATIDYEIALEEQKYKEGKISLQEYLTFRERRTEDYVNRIIYLKQLELEELRKQPEANLDKIKAIEEEIKQIKLRSAQEQLSIRQELTSGLKQEYQKDFDSWKKLQELRLGTLKSQLDLEDAVEQAAVQRGEMREEEYLNRKLQRIRKAYGEEIRIAEEAVRKIAEANAKKEQLTEEDIIAYEEALAAKEKLQNEYQKAIIKSEQEIAETKVKVTKESAEKTIEATKEEAKAVFAITTETLNAYIDYVDNRRAKLQAAVKGILTDTWDDVKQYFGEWKEAVNTTVTDVQYQVDEFMRKTTMTSYDTFWNAQIFGRKMVEMVGTSVFEWAQRVTDYINHVKSLLQSLQDYIDSLRMQLMQLRGDRLGEIEMWYEQEKKKLEEKYADELGRTKEYYEAMALLDEIYKEKKKKVLEEMERDEQEYLGEEKSKVRGTAGSAGGIRDIVSGLVPDLSGLAMAAAGIPTTEVTVTKKLEWDLNINPPPSFDPETTNRWLDDVLIPALNRKLQLRGLDLL